MKCVICKSGTKEIFKDTFQCGLCRHIYRDYRGDATKLYQEGIYRKGNPPKDPSVRIKHADKLLSIVSDYVKLDNEDILDIGCGDGNFLSRLSTYSDTCFGVEPDPNMANLCREKGLSVSCYDLNNVRQTYSICFMNDVLEHIKNPFEAAKKLSQICQKYLVVQVPCNRQNKPVQSNFDGHYHYFSKASLNYVFTNNGFKCILLQNNPRGITSNGESMLCIMSKK